MDASAAGEGMLGFVTRVPIGVVAGITPFNFPLNLVCHKIAPAVAAGVPMVLKPASATPLTALRIAALFEECGLPPGWLNVVTCDGATAAHLVKHPGVSMVTFTGSGPVGWGIRANAPKKRVGLELGNNAPLIIESDADVDHAARIESWPVDLAIRVRAASRSSASMPTATSMGNSPRRSCHVSRSSVSAIRPIRLPPSVR